MVGEERDRVGDERVDLSGPSRPAGTARSTCWSPTPACPGRRWPVPPTGSRWSSAPTTWALRPHQPAPGARHRAGG